MSFLQRFCQMNDRSGAVCKGKGSVWVLAWRTVARIAEIYGDLSNTVQSTVLCGETVGRAGRYWVA